MLCVRWAAGLWLLVLVSLTGASTALPRCPSSELVTYRLDIQTHWSKRRFPKQYPLFRPPAQFSKFVGMSHNSSRVIFRPGELATEAVRRFAEQADASGIEVVAQGHPGVLDQFTTPPVKQGEGSALVRIFVDGVHSQVSLLSRIVPSPDWFIGIDSVDLCDSGRWIDSMDVKLFPMDAGTDQGLTFTSPNWESDPHEPICQITSKKPSHPAGSFNYPGVASLPHIASIRFTRVGSFVLSGELEGRDGASCAGDTASAPRLGPGGAAEDPAGTRSPAASSASSSRAALRLYNTTSGGAATTAAPPGRRTQTRPTTHTPKLKIPSKAAAAAEDRTVNEITYWSPRKETGSKKHWSEKLTSSEKTHSSNTWTPLQSSVGQSSVPLSHSGAPSVPRSQSSHNILRPSDPSSVARVALRPDGSVARVALRPDGSISRVALRPDGSVARVALRPGGRPVRIGGLRVWAVNSTAAGVEGARVDAGDKKAIIKKIADHYRRNRSRHRRRRLRHRKHKRVPRDCSVGSWSQWGPCSRTCGIGETTRSRGVKLHARRGGRPCPGLTQRRWCGSARSCSQRRRYFQW